MFSKAVDGVHRESICYCVHYAIAVSTNSWVRGFLTNWTLHDSVDGSFSSKPVLTEGYLRNCVRTSSISTLYQ